MNALIAGQKRKRITGDLVRTFLSDLAKLPVALDCPPAEMIFKRIHRLSREHDLNAYDATYLDLALENGLVLATLDRNLMKACKETGVELP